LILTLSKRYPVLEEGAARAHNSAWLNKTWFSWSILLIYLGNSFCTTAPNDEPHHAMSAPVDDISVNEQY
jgi:hypothetical protein